MLNLIQNYRRLLAETETTVVRYLYPQVEWDARFVAILGARGVGKTTMLLQHILLTHTEDQSLYVTANDTYFSSRTLYDLADEFYRNGGKVLYIDEIHKYPGWSNEVKMMYDNLKKLQVIISGSSMLAIRKAIDADNSRRIVPYTLEGLSFREFLNMKLGLDIQPVKLEDVLAGKVYLPKEIDHPLAFYKEFVESGYFPFFKEKLYLQRLQGIITASLEEDIAQYADLTASQVRILKHLLLAVATSVPYKPNYSDIGRVLSTDRKDVPTYLIYLEKSGLTRMLFAEGEGNTYLEKAEKIYLSNTNFIHALSAKSSKVGNIRETSFLCSVSVGHDVRASKKGDFVVDSQYTFEVGGRNKTTDQIRGVPSSYVVMDDLEFPSERVIPLWMFGFLY